jgi:hypothetical protein
VSACKWLRDIEVTTYNTFTAYWTDRGWSEMGPVKLASRIDVPRSGDGVAAGKVAVAGAAWQQEVGIKAVEVQLDGGAWQPATLSRVNLKDAWVQWVATLEVAKGDHTVRVRATNRLGEVQTAARAAPAPNGATGWDAVQFSAS